MKRKFGRWWVGLVVVSLLLAACGGSPAPAAETAATAPSGDAAADSGRCGDRSKLAKSVSFYNWTDYINPEVLDKLTERERRNLGIEPLPKNLNDAITIAEHSELLAETLGEQVFDFFLRNKRAEWDEYRGQVSVFERDRMLPVL